MNLKRILPFIALLAVFCLAETTCYSQDRIAAYAEYSLDQKAEKASNSLDHVVINEVLSSNTRGQYDQDFGAFSDWIELHNPLAENVDLEGWYLSDDPQQADKWRIPDNTLIPAGGYLLFWADGKDIKPGQQTTVEFTDPETITVSEYHINFRINRDGESLSLSDPELLLIDSISLPEQERDISFGRRKADPDQWVFFAEASPNEVNSDQDAEEAVYAGAPTFSLEGGFYASGVSVSITAEPGETIHYTIDGSVPGINSPVYTEPIPIYFSQVIKARIYEEGKLPGDPLTRSYIIDKETSLPVLSVSTNYNNLWGFDFGLYQNNYKNREIPAHLEYFDEQGDQAFQLNAGLQLFGSQIFLFDQKPFSIFFRNRYGQDTLQYRLFAGKDLSTFHSLVLRNGGNDNNLAFFRDGLGAKIVENQLDLDYQAYQPVVVYVNGEYWGIFNLREKLNEEYLQGNHGINPDHLDLMEDSLRVNNGDANAFKNLYDFVRSSDLNNPENYEFLVEKIDIDEFINYMSLKVYAAYKQWQVNNKYWKERSPGSRWRWIAFDLEHGFGGPGGEYYDSNPFLSLMDPDNDFTSWYTLLFRKLMDNEKFRAAFIQRTALLLQTVYSGERVSGIIDTMQAEIENEMDDHILRWNSPFSMEFWRQQVQFLREFASQRNDFLLDHMMEYFKAGGSSDLTITKTEGGSVQLCSAHTMNSDSLTFSFFHKFPVKLAAIPAPGYTFSGWNEELFDAELDLILTGDTLLRAVFTEDRTFVLPDTIRDSLLVSDMGEPWKSVGNIIIPAGKKLVIGAGVSLEMAQGANIVNRGTLLIEGSPEDPVLITSNPFYAALSYPSGAYCWGGIIIESNEKTLLKDLHLEGATSGLDYGDYKGAITIVKSSDVHLKGIHISGVANPIYAYQSEIKIDSCILSSNNPGDLINLRDCVNPIITNCTLRGNFYEDTDAIDLDSINGAIVDGNRIFSFFGFNSDGIDLGEHSTGVLITNNTILSISDKGVSVGQGSVTEARGNIIVDCDQGFGIKDFDSFALINQNTLFANRTGVAVFEKNEGKGGGAAQLENTIISGSVVQSVFVDELSSATVSYSLSDTDTLPGFNNLYTDPLFLNDASLIFELSEGSPCINGGLPNQQDPDGSRADIGAFIESGTASDTNILITEVNYNSHERFNTGDWLEIFNPGMETKDLSGYIMKGQDYADEYVFRDQLSLDPQSYLAIAQEKDSLLHYHGEGIPAEGNFNFGLGSQGELLRIYDKNYKLISALRYRSDLPWLSGANGSGASLEIIDPSGKSNNAWNWQTSFVPGGSPGEENSQVNPIDGIYINEFMAKNDGAYADPFGEYDDWFEIYNQNAFPLDLGGLYFLADSDEKNLVMIPYFHEDTTMVAGGDFAVFWADGDPEQGGAHLDLRLPASGSTLGIGYILNGEMQYIDKLTYGAQEADIAYGRYPDGSDSFMALQLTPGTSNGLSGMANPLSPGMQFWMYPNPTDDHFFIEVKYPTYDGIFSDASNPEAGILRCSIYSSSAQLMIEEEIESGIANRINISVLPPGIYVVRIKGSPHWGKLIVR